METPLYIEEMKNKKCSIRRFIIGSQNCMDCAYYRTQAAHATRPICVADEYSQEHHERTIAMRLAMECGHDTI